MPENRTCFLSIIYGSYGGINLKYNLWPEIHFYKMSKIWYETGITRFTFILIVHKCVVEVANLCIADRNLRILYE